ncbi:hypothetical protein AOLI_G00007330 [Acnodon oligacanthus]
MRAVDDAARDERQPADPLMQLNLRPSPSISRAHLSTAARLHGRAVSDLTFDRQRMTKQRSALLQSAEEPRRMSALEAGR